jgi:transcription elongation factor GreA-like protein
VGQFAMQDQVTHDKYGLGRVIGVEDDTALVIDFGSRHVRIMTPFAKLTRL